MGIFTTAFIGLVASHTESFQLIGRSISSRLFASVSGTVYDSKPGTPVIKLYTKEDCSLCDKVKDVLQAVRITHPHSLVAVDITDPENREYYQKYKVRSLL